MPKKMYIKATGRRKTATASVRLSKGTDEIIINDVTPKQYFAEYKEVKKIFLCPLELCGLLNKYDISIRVSGGGKKAQIDAIRLAIARAIVSVKDEYKQTLKKAKLLTRDSREKERKKPGLKRARRAPQWQKR